MRLLLIVLLAGCAAAQPLNATDHSHVHSSRRTNAPNSKRRFTTAAAQLPEVNCPTTTKDVRRGSDLSVAAAAPNITYLLEPGQYSISSTIYINRYFNVSDTTTCYRGTGSSREDVVVQVNTGATAAIYSAGRNALGLFSLILDGQDASRGVYVSGTAGRITTNDVTFQRFYTTTNRLFPNAALTLAQLEPSSLINTAFLENRCEDCPASALFADSTTTLPMTLILSEVVFRANTCTGNGCSAAMAAQFVTNLQLNGVSFADNTATVSGSSNLYPSSCMWLYRCPVTVSSMCAYNNRVQVGPGAGFNPGSCITLDSEASIRFPPPSISNMAENRPHDIVVVNRPAAGVTCGNSNSSWRPGNYSITGPVCACDGEFVDGSSTACDSCGKLCCTYPCACAQCEPGVGQCCTSSGAFDTTTVCRHPEPGSCKLPTVCDGTSATCPSQQPSKPDGVRCKWHPGNGRHNAAHASVTSVSAAEAAGWLTGRKPYPSYDSDSEEEPDWPQCKGVCLYGHCALKWDTPACCYVQKYHHHTAKGSGYDAYAAAPYHAAEGDEDDMAAETSSIGYDSGGKQWFCWGK